MQLSEMYEAGRIKNSSGMYSEPSQDGTFGENINGRTLLTFFARSSILDVLLGSECASVDRDYPLQKSSLACRRISWGQTQIIFQVT